jgi:hypothetical protein
MLAERLEDNVGDVLDSDVAHAQSSSIRVLWPATFPQRADNLILPRNKGVRQ